MMDLQSTHYDANYKFVEYAVADLMFPNIINLIVENVSGKMKGKLVGVFKIVERTGK